MRLNVWQSGLIAGFFLLFLGLAIDNPLLDRATDTFLIFGIIIVAISSGVAVVALVKRI